MIQLNMNNQPTSHQTNCSDKKSIYKKKENGFVDQL